MKLKTQGKFSLSKKAKIAVAVGSAVVVGVTALIVVNKVRDKNTFYSKFNDFASVETCNFRYVIDVRSSEAKDKGSMTAEELENALNDTAFENEDGSATNKGYDYEDTTEGNYVAPDGDQTGNLYQEHIQTDWTTQDGSVAVNWEYPNYELIIEGRVESVEPLQATVQMKMATDYTNAPFLNATFIDNKCYFDVFTLKNWLLSAGDSSLVQLGKSIPDGVVYVVVEDGKINFATGLAEEGETEFSGATDVYNLYQRFVAAEKACMTILQKGMSDTGLSKDDTRYRLSISNDDSIKLVDTIRSAVNNSGSYYQSYVKMLTDNGIADEAHTTQLLNEKDNFISAIQPLWAALNGLSSEDKSALNLTVVGKARDYSSSNVPYKEITLGTSFVWEGTEYIISVYGCKSGLAGDNGIKVEVPKETCTDISAVDVDFSSISEYLLAYFKFTPEYPVYRLDSTWDTFEDVKLRAFADLVNAENERENTGIAKVNMYNIQSYISNYAEMTETEYNVNPATKFNYDLVKKYLNSDEVEEQGSDEDLQPKVASKEVEATIEGISLKFSNAKMTIPNLISVSLSAVIDTEDDIEKSFDLTQLYVLDSNGNKYPCNHKDFIRDANVGVSTSNVITELSVSSDTKYATLYFITDGFDTYTLYYNNTELGHIVEAE